MTCGNSLGFLPVELAKLRGFGYFTNQLVK
jgi:hypothetical protein